MTILASGTMKAVNFAAFILPEAVQLNAHHENRVGEDVPSFWSMTVVPSPF